jgi:hypothetical protein
MIFNYQFLHAKLVIYVDITKYLTHFNIYQMKGEWQSEGNEEKAHPVCNSAGIINRMVMDARVNIFAFRITPRGVCV